MSQVRKMGENNTGLTKVLIGICCFCVIGTVALLIFNKANKRTITVNNTTTTEEIVITTTEPTTTTEVITTKPITTKKTTKSTNNR